MADLDDLRGRIDRIDRELVRLLAERAEVAGAIGARKRESGQAALDAARERDLLERLAGEERGGLPLAGLQAIFREILSASRAVQGGARVGYLGQPGGFAPRTRSVSTRIRPRSRCAPAGAARCPRGSR